MGTPSKWEALITIPTGDWTASLTESGGGGAQTITLSATETYYWSSAGNNSVSIASRLKTILEAASVTAGNSNTYTVTPALGALGAGTLVISVDAGTYTLTSVDADLLALMGFTGDLTPTASSFTGTQHMESSWLPDCPVETPFGLDSAGMPVSAASNSLSEDGSAFCFQGAVRVDNNYVYQAVSIEKAVTTSETTTAASYQSFWADCIRGEEPWCAVPSAQLRYYKDADTDGTFITFNVTDSGQPNVVRHSANFDGYWTIRLDVTEN